MQVSAVISPSPSFNSYSNCNLAQVAARVVQDEDNTTIPGVYEPVESDIDGGGGGEEEEFDFAFVRRGGSESFSPISADEIFHNGMIRPVYPISHPNLLLGNTKDHGRADETRMNSGLLKGVKIGTPLRKLFTGERESSTASSCSSSEADELDGVSSEMYCVWQPKSPAEGRLKKSSSTGWKFKGFLQKSHSVGSNGSFALASLDDGGRKRDECVMLSPVSRHGAWKDDFVCSSSSRTAGKCIPPMYKRDAGEKRRSHLPYRHDLAGFFANVNRFSKNFHPF
ncbi:uncharacterized protein [Henckelia pumila]|uniref:uncharacterized protein n=1 Tax=Henckelia pumila TaxID=405737 RepID=UPI003C6E27D1